MQSDESRALQRASDPWLEDQSDLSTPGMEVLELGCGAGDDCADLLRLGAEVIAFDRALRNLRSARRRAPGMRVVHGDMRQRLPFPDERFDAVVASLSIHYFDWATSEAIMAEVRRVLRPGGWFITRVNRVGDINFEYGQGIEIEPEYFEVQPGFYKRFFTFESFRALLETQFRVDSIVPQVSRRWQREKQTLVARAQRQG